MKKRWPAGIVLAVTAAFAGEPPTLGPDVWLFDMGRPDSPVQPGFAQVTPQSRYTPERGWGWTTPAKNLRGHVASTLDALAIDEISGRLRTPAGFRVDVPPGQYTVWVLTGAMGNMWRLRYLRVPHSLYVQGRKAVTVSFPEAALFRPANYDWRPDDDIWNVFIRPRFRWVRADADAPEGKVFLQFRRSVDFPVNAIIVARRALRSRVEKEIAKIDAMRRRFFFGIWEEVRPEPEKKAPVTEAERRRGYIAAAVRCSRDLTPWSQPIPADSREQVRIFATPGAQEQASFAVYALRDLEDVRFTLSPVQGPSGTLPAPAFRPGLVQFLPWRSGGRNGTTWSIRECLILPPRPTFIAGGTCKRFWITLDTPADAPPGVYHGSIRVEARNAPPVSLNLSVRVTPVHLDTPPVERFMYFGTMYYLARAYLPEFDEDLYWKAIRAEVRFMRDNQFCRAECIIPRGSGAITIENGRVVDVDLRDTARLMKILREEHAWPRDNTMICRTGSLNIRFGGHFRRPGSPSIEFVPDPARRKLFAQAIRLIDRRAKAEGWPEVAFECLGEFTNYGEDGRKFAIEVHSLFHRLGVSNTLRGNGPSDMAAIERGLVRYPQPNWAMMHPRELNVMRRVGKRLWAYNFARSRYAMGWFCFKHGITRAGYESGVYANGQPGNSFETPTMFPMGLPTSMTTIAPTVWLKRLVQGAVDYEYLYTLERRIGQAAKSGNPEAARRAKQARAWLDARLAEIPYGVSYMRGDPRTDRDVQGRFWPPGALDRYRQEAARFIVDIEEALGQPR